VGNTASNIIPARASARLNIRFNDRHDGAGLTDWLRAVLSAHAERFECDVTISGEAFLTTPGDAVERLRAAVAAVSGVAPRLDTGGGTSDARFITHLCPVAEFGLVGTTMHQVDECVKVAELSALTEIYQAVIAAFLPNDRAAPP
jgi:succinyl-diaminopimelate desuccinylase